MNPEAKKVHDRSVTISQYIDQVTCVECCKYYIYPETAVCTHVLCHGCWSGRKACPVCSEPVDRKRLKVNSRLVKLTEHVQALVQAFEQHHKVKLDEFMMHFDVEPEDDPSKTVKDWLGNSQNHFSPPTQNSDQLSQTLHNDSNILIQSSTKALVHTKTKKTMSPKKVAINPISPQVDMDKIEVVESVKIVDKDEEIEPMNIEPFFIDENAYTANNPRRSSRKNKHKNNDVDISTNNNIRKDIVTPTYASDKADNKLNNTNSKQNWNNVKKMRKEFSKLNKINKNKLNVSIEMCKKAQTAKRKKVNLQKENNSHVTELDDNTSIPATTKIPLDGIPGVNLEVDSSNDCGTDVPQKSKSNSNNCILNKMSINMSQTTVSDIKQKIPEPTTRMLFYKKGALCPSSNFDKEIETVSQNIEANLNNNNTNDDIEIRIKVGNTITNIVIHKNDDTQVKVNTDKSIQTSLCPQQKDKTQVNTISDQGTKNVSINIDSNNQINIEHKQITENLKKNISASLKTASAKKNTASADTGTGQFEITESVEKELSDLMECAEIAHGNKTESSKSIPRQVSNRIRTPLHTNVENVSQRKKTPNSQCKPTIYTVQSQQNFTSKSQADLHSNKDNLDYSNDMDIFESDNITETNAVNMLKTAITSAPSEILISTAHNKEKRGREANDEEPASKKQKVSNSITKKNESNISMQNIQNVPESEPMNYDSVMGKVFASIDADMEEIKSQNLESKAGNIISKNTIIQYADTDKQKENPISEKYVIDSTPNSNDLHNQKDSENLFTVCMEKDDVIEPRLRHKLDKMPPSEPPSNIDYFLTPVMNKNDGVIEIANDDSESVVEDTPQKSTSFGILKQKSISASKEINASQRHAREKATNSITAGKENYIVDLVNTPKTSSSNNVTVLETSKKTPLETPLNIKKFVDQIKHNSTPMAKKSLNFQNKLDDIDPELTLCPSDTVAETTQEKEFMRKAFETTPRSQIVIPQARRLQRGNIKLCIAGSCLSSGEVGKLRLLCRERKWSYVDKYTRDITHLVVGVDDENKSQRSVKYMQALAASKWIISYEWVEKCLQTKQVVGEDIYEVLDSTGEPGPRRSRVANKRLFDGITFFCMEPFRALDVASLKEMLEASGGHVVSEEQEVRVNDRTTAPALLLAEPEHTQEDKYIFHALAGIVPVNYEWVLNSLGSYTLCSIQDLLLCPLSLLPKATGEWPEELMTREED